MPARFPRLAPADLPVRVRPGPTTRPHRIPWSGSLPLPELAVIITFGLVLVLA
jgi:hypothetical protein